MTRPKTPIEREKERAQPSSKSRPTERQEDFERTIPGRRSPEYVKQRDRAVNEDEQLKATNYREDNAQSTTEGATETSHTEQPQENENERIEAGDDYSEVGSRGRKVN